jgi:broad specificity phosphatase PhoE
MGMEKEAPKTTLIDLLRHGEPEGGRRYRGSIDDPLSERGWQQMWHTVGDEPLWNHVISSPMNRCRAFAEALCERHQISLAQDDRLREVGFGAWEGKTAAELKQVNAEQFFGFYQDPVRHRPEGAEILAGFCARVAAALGDIADQHPARHVLIVTHAGVIRAAISMILKTSPSDLYRVSVPSASITRLRFSAERPPELLHHGLATLADL